MDFHQRAARLHRWLNEHGTSSASLHTTVSDPKAARGGGVSSAVFGPTTLFTISTESPDDNRRDIWTVERSMADFNLLRSTLIERFPGAVLGHLPESRMTDFAKSKEELHTKQAEILNHFLRFLCRHPFISQDQVFLSFLSVNGKFSDSIKTLAPPTSGSGFRLKMLQSASRNRRKSLQRGLSAPLNEEPTSAADWWREAIELAEPPADPLKVCKDVLSEIERISKRLIELKVVVRDFREKLKAVGGTCMDLHKAFQNWLAIEYSPDALTLTSKDNIPTAELVAPADPNGMVTVSMSMPMLLSENSNRFQAQGLIHQKMALDSAATLLSAIREEILVLDALKENVNQSRDAVLRVEEAKAVLARKERELSNIEDQVRMERVQELGQGSDAAYAFEATSDPTYERKTRAARKAKDDATATLESANLVAFSLTRAALSIELNFFREERIVRSDKFFSEFAQVHADYCAKSHSIWNLKSSSSIPLKTVSSKLEKVEKAQVVKSALAKSLMYGNTDENELSDFNSGALLDTENDRSDLKSLEEHEGQTKTPDEVERETFVEWGPDIPWDPDVSRPIQVIFDFEPEHSDELEAKEGDRGIAIPFDEDRLWLHATLTNGQSGIIPTDFVRVIETVKETLSSQEPQRLTNGVQPTVEPNNNRVKQLESQLIQVKQENEKLTSLLEERDSYIAAHDNELLEANHSANQWKTEFQKVQSERDSIIKERDQFKVERDHALAEFERLLHEHNEQDEIRKKSSLKKSTSPALESKEPIAMEDDLPPHWIRGFDKTRNRYFFHNTVTKESVWRKPTATKASSTTATKRKLGDS